MAALRPINNPNWPYIKVEIAFPDNWNAPVTWTDVTSRIRFANGGVKWSRGRNDAYQQVTPGTCEITFNNRDRAFDPTYSGSPFAGYLDPARPVRITAYWPTTSTAYIQFYGQIEDWVPKWAPGGDSVCVATGVDLMGALSFCRIVGAGFISLTAANRLRDLCNRAGIPAGQQSFAAGPYAIQAQTYTNTDVLSACQEVVGGQSQVFYCTRDGILKSVGMFAATSSSIGTFGDQAGELPYTALEPSVGGGYLYTQVVVSPSPPTGAPAANPASKNVSSGYISRYGTRTLSLTVAATTSALALSAATAIASSLASQDLTRVKSASPLPLADPADAWPVVLGADFGNPATFNYAPPGGGTRFSESSKIRSISHSITTSGWDVNWNLSK